MPSEYELMTVPQRGFVGVSGVLRLVVLALTLTGFVAMHGVASAAGGAHCGAPPALTMTTLTMTSSAHGVAHGGAHSVTQGSTADHGTTTATVYLAGAGAGAGAGVGAPAPSSEPTDLMVGCLLALLGALVALGLHLLRGRGSVVVCAVTRQALAWLRGARGPPDPLFLSLCVFRL